MTPFEKATAILEADSLAASGITAKRHDSEYTVEYVLSYPSDAARSAVIDDIYSKLVALSHACDGGATALRFDWLSVPGGTAIVKLHVPRATQPSLT